MLAPPGSWRPLLGEILALPLGLIEPHLFRENLTVYIRVTVAAPKIKEKLTFAFVPFQMFCVFFMISDVWFNLTLTYLV